MDANETLNEAANTILEKPVRISVDVLNPRWWEKIAIKLKLAKPVKTFDIRPATLGNMFRISQLMLQVEPVETGSAMSVNHELIELHCEKLAKVVAIAVNNRKSEPTQREVRFFMDNLTSAELFRLTLTIIQRLGIENFLRSITLLRGVSLLKAGEVIAPGERSEA